ncbi:MAG: membrane protein insertase YidC [Pikeienuella sp.]
MGDKDETRNLILAVALSMLVIVVWYAIFPPPEPAPVEPQTAEQTAVPETGTGVSDGAGAGRTAGVAATVAMTREAALTRTERIALETPALRGSISLSGGRIDDLDLTRYRETLEPDSPNVTLLNPTRAPEPYYVVYGWLPTADGAPGALPGPSTPWEIESGRMLTPQSPVTLVWDNGEGLTFRRRIEVDDRYMMTVTQSVENATEAAVALAPYAYIARRGTPQTGGLFILHEGAIGSADGVLREIAYQEGFFADGFDGLTLDARKDEFFEATRVEGNGWLGFTDKYWMTVLVPEPGQSFRQIYKLIPGQRPEYRTEMLLPTVSAAPGQVAETTTRLFSGAKEVETIRAYQETFGLQQFEDAVDWGWFYFLTKPFFFLLHNFYLLIGNMGWAIILLTVLVKAVLFPLAYKSYVSMSKMKALQPEMEKIKARAGDDRMKLQQEMMELYKKEKVNPAAGCLPILLQIPIFFALYKVLFVTIEMRHAPFFGWIEDLSAPDPSSWMTLFGLFPWEIPAVLTIFSIGVFPILMGVTMWLQQKLNPAPTDPTQQMIFAWLPWVFMFMLGQFAVGLVIYWTANNTLTIIQQYAIMRSQGVDVDLLGNIKKSFKKKPAQE